MKVVHYAEFSPNACGLYHTTKDLVKAERGQGIDAHFVDVTSKDGIAVYEQPGKTDGWMTTSDPAVADNADILVRHTSIPGEMENSGIPICMAIHGRPESSLLIDEQGDNPVIEAFYNKGQDCRYKAFFTFWKEHVSFWKRIVPEHKLHVIPAMVDLMEWRPTGKPFDLGEHKGNPNILIADIWRDDVTPFNEVMAVAEWIRTECPTAKLHIAAAPTGKGANILWRALRKEGVLGYACGQTKDIKALYEACDVVVTPHAMDTRIRREAAAMATPVVSASFLPTWWKAHTEDVAKKEIRVARGIAQECYRLSNAGQAAKTIYEGILNQKPTKRKVLLDIGGHIGETVRRFYREVEDARFYEIHSFEPHPDCFKKLCEVTKRMKNVLCHPEAVVGLPLSGSRLLFPATVNEHEGSTMLLGKTTGEVHYTDPITVITTEIGAFMIKQTLGQADVILKMNIEGAEYEIMESILRQDILPFFKQIYVQTHKHKLAKMEFQKRMEIEDRFLAAAEQAKVKVFMTEKGMARFQCSPD